MRIYKTRKDFTTLNTLGNPGVFAGTVCTIIDEPANPMYAFQGGAWTGVVVGTTNPVTGVIRILLPDGSYASIPKQSDSGLDYVAYGLTLPTSGTIGIASIAAGVAYVSGYRIPHAGSVLALEATKDHYIDLDYSGSVIVSAVAVAAAAPAKAANSIRLGYVTANASAVTAAVTGAADSNGVWMGNVCAQPASRCVNGNAFSSGTGELACTFGATHTKFANSTIHSETLNPTRFTAPVAGIYSATGFVQIQAAGAGAAWNTKIYKNGASAALGTHQGMDNTNLLLAPSAIIEMAAGDYLTLQRNFTTAQTLAAIGFSMVRIA